MDRNEIIAALNANLLLPSAISRAEDTVKITHRDYLAKPQAELDALRARYEAEAPIRKVREQVKAKGVIPSKFGPGYCARHPVTGRWVKLTTEQAADVVCGSFIWLV